jgi:hypothetical protein
VKAFELNPARRWAFCLTHPDDEIAICAWIHRLAQSGNEVFLAWTHSNRVRENEARAVAHLLGVPQSNLTFFGATDGRVCDEMTDLLPQFRAYFDEIKPDRVCCGAFECGHIDHDATNFLVNHSYEGPIYEIPLYHAYCKRFQRLNRFAQRAGEEVWNLELDDQKLKISIARQYPSQNIWSILRWYNLFHKPFRPMALLESERMRRQTHVDFLSPNLPPRLAAKVKRTLTWYRWTHAVQAALPAVLREAKAPVKV